MVAPSVIYYQAGEPHGMRNVGRQPARYLVFEFHAAISSAPLWHRLTRFPVFESVSRIAPSRKRLAKTAKKLGRRAKKTTRLVVRRALPSWGIARAGLQLGQT